MRWELSYHYCEETDELMASGCVLRVSRLQRHQLSIFVNLFCQTTSKFLDEGGVRLEVQKQVSRDSGTGLSFRTVDQYLRFLDSA